MEVSFHNEIIINNSVNRIYEYLRKMENFSNWNYAVMNVEPIGDYKERNTYRLKRDLGQSVEVETVTLLELQHNQYLHFEATGGRFPYEAKYELKQVGNRTLLNNIVNMKPTGLNSFLLKLFKSNIQAEVKKNLTVLKNILE
ncbi:SRPBCC family protein [Bacillus sp. 03113]|uniref:SRPBCC family protein n=1 Tax=Bacillus sp. 03113 TaxID=2578211 RepID=UPI001143F0C2|nr:SRPBCC family protein [Bacillus sp. 03113]